MIFFKKDSRITELPPPQLSVPGCRLLHGRTLVSDPPAQDLADAAVADPQLSGDVAGPDALVGQLHDPLPHHVREGSAVHKHPAELIHTAVPCVGYNSSTGEHNITYLQRTASLHVDSI